MEPGGGPWSNLPPPPPVRPGRPGLHWRARLALYLAIAAGAGLGLWLLSRLNPTQTFTARDWGGASMLIAMLCLASARLFVQRLPARRMLGYAVGWMAIVAVLFAGFAFGDELGFVGARLGSELAPSTPVATGAHEMVLTEDEDGAFHVIGTVDGQAVRFLVDTGSSDIVLSPGDARRLGLDMAALHFTSVAETANGEVRGAPFKADALTVGQVSLHDVPMVVNQAPMSASLLGLSFLKGLQSFEVRGRRLYLRWSDLTPAGS